MAGDVVWLDVLPSLGQFAGKLVSGTEKAATDAGKSSGSAWSKAFGQTAGDGGTSKATDELVSNEKRAKKAVEDATTAIGQARAAQRTAAAQTVLAEEKLADAVAKYGPDSAKAEAASLRLEAAREKQTIADNKLERAETAVRAAHRESKEATEQLEKATKSANSEAEESVSAWAGVGKSLGGLKDSLKEAVGGFGGLLTTAAGAVGSAKVFSDAWADTLDLSKGTAKVSAALGLTEAESEVAGETAGALFSDGYGESIDDVNTAIESVMSSLKGMRTASTADLEAVTGKAMSLAQAFDLDVSEATRSAAQLINQGLAKDATEAFDLITASLQKVPAALRGEVMDATHEYSQFFSALGITGPQAMNLLTNAAEDGQYGIDKMGDALKEFTIRSTDMSKSTEAAYAQISGWDVSEIDKKSEEGQRALQMISDGAQGMANNFLVGGETANQAFQDVIAGLLRIEDPADQASAAIALFGTPLEDLNVAEIPAFLESLSSMGEGLGDVTGKAADLDDKMAETVDPVESLKRSFMGILSEALLPLVDPLQDFSQWAKENPALMQGVAVAFGILSAAIGVATIAWAGMTIAASPWLVIAAAIAAAVAAAVAIIVVAVKNWGSITDWVKEKWEPIGQWFSDLWQGIKDAASVVVDWFSETVLPVLTAIWDGIKAGADAMWTGIKVIFVTWATAWSLLADGLTWVYDHTIKPMWDAYKKMLKAAWDWIKQYVFDPIAAGWAKVADGFKWVYENVILAAWDAYKKALKAGWDWIKQYVFDPLKNAWNAVGDGFKWVNDKVIQPAWNGLKTLLKNTWDWIGDKVFNPMKKGVEAIGTVFGKTKDVIGAAWDKIKGVAAKPVNFIIETVYTKGIKNTWDKIAEKVGLNLKLPTISPIKLATGGIMPGYTPGRDVHTFVSPTGGVLELSGGEPVMRPEFGAAMGHDWIHAMNKAARMGGVGGVKSAVAQSLGGQAFAEGGIWDRVKSGAKSAWNWTTNAAGKAWDWTKNAAESVANFISDPIGALTDLIGKPVNALMSKIAPGFVGDILKQVPGKFLDGLGDWVTRALRGREVEGAPAGAGPAGSIGMGYKAMVSLLKARFPDLAITSTYRPGAITATGYPSMHGKGRAVDMAPRMDVFDWLRASYPNSTELIYSPAGNRQLYQGKNHYYTGVTRQMHFNHVHWAMANGGLLPEDLNFGTYDTGGVLPPGDTLVSNNTGLPELILNPQQIDALGRPDGPFDLSDDTIDRMAERIAEELGVVGETVNDVRETVRRARTLERTA